ncbi:hypothetical protein FQN50_003605 [Emmonsiellopsis sp. PD_5]|nr:hypothetical protein FQN50_003605 [Emmonsiellopsis sp. PD_5]
MENHGPTSTHEYEGFLDNYSNDDWERLFFDTGATVDNFVLRPGSPKNPLTDGTRSSRSNEALNLEIDKLKEQAVIELQESMRELKPWTQRIDRVLRQLFGHTRSLSERLLAVQKCYLDIEGQKADLDEEHYKVLRTLNFAQRSCLNQLREIEVQLRALERKHRLLKKDNEFLVREVQRLVDAEPRMGSEDGKEVYTEADEGI